MSTGDDSLSQTQVVNSELIDEDPPEHSPCVCASQNFKHKSRQGFMTKGTGGVPSPTTG